MQPQVRLLVAAGVVWLDPRTLLLQRRPAQARHGALRLEFVGGKVEPRESPAQALARELTEEWGPHARRLRIGAPADILHHVYPPPGPEVVLCLYHVDARRWRGSWQEAVAACEGATVDAVSIDALPVEEFLEADRPFVVRIARGEVSSPFGS